MSSLLSLCCCSQSEMFKPSMALLCAITFILHQNIEPVSGEDGGGGEGGVDYWVGTMPPPGAPPRPAPTAPAAAQSQRPLRYMWWKGVKLYDFQKSYLLFKLYNAGTLPLTGTTTLTPAMTQAG